MPGHLHWLIVRDTIELSGVMRLFKGKTGFVLNHRLGQKGAFWQRSFYDYALRKEEDLQVAAGYIVTSPLRAGLVEHIADYLHWDAEWI